MFTTLYQSFYCISSTKSNTVIQLKLSSIYRAFIYYVRVHYFVLKCRLLNHSVLTLFNDVVRKYPEKVAIYYKDESWTFKQLDIFSNQIANYFTDIGYRVNDE